MLNNVLKIVGNLNLRAYNYGKVNFPYGFRQARSCLIRHIKVKSKIKSIIVWNFRKFDDFWN